MTTTPLWRAIPGDKQLAMRKGLFIANPEARVFSPKTFMAQVSQGRTAQDYESKQVIFSQGEPADAVFYIQTGKVQLIVVSKRGKEAVIAILQKGDFFGEGSLVGQPLRIASATAMPRARVVRLSR